MIRKLIEKHIEGTLSKEEGLLLAHLVRQTSDEELKAVLGKLWDHYDKKMDLPEDLRLPASLVKTDTGEIHEEKNIGFGNADGNGSVRGIFAEGKNVIRGKRSQPRKLLRTVIGVAAAIAMFCLVGTGIRLHRENERLSGIVAENSMTIKTPDGDKTELTLPDGTTVILNSKTTLHCEGKYGLDERRVTLDGEAFFNVAKDVDRPFILTAGDVSIEVLGTQFNVSAYKERSVIETFLAEGSVKLRTSGKEEHQIIMKPSDKVVFDKVSGSMSVTQSDAEVETAWISGGIVFKSSGFMEIMEKLGQHYGVGIEIKGKNIDNGLFTGHFNEADIDSVLDILRLHYAFTYAHKDGKIIVYIQK